MSWQCEQCTDITIAIISAIITDLMSVASDGGGGNVSGGYCSPATAVAVIVAEAMMGTLYMCCRGAVLLSHLHQRSVPLQALLVDLPTNCVFRVPSSGARVQARHKSSQ